jgi:hypothetical protein
MRWSPTIPAQIFYRELLLMLPSPTMTGVLRCPHVHAAHAEDIVASKKCFISKQHSQ